jgi:effector-binding domain-containing protein
MLNEPRVEVYNEKPYVAIRSKVNMYDIPAVLPPLIPEVLAWVAKNNATPNGPAFFLYRSMNKHNEIDIEVGVPVEGRLTGDGRIVEGALPAGKYATIKYIGDYQYIKEAHIALESWIAKNGLKEKQVITPDGVLWGARIESYITDPQEETNPEKWETNIVFLLEDSRK